MTGPADAWTEQVTRVLAPNPGPMTLDGTNTLIVRDAASRGVIVVDPGPDDDGHLQRVASFGPVELILVTHHHADHVAGARPLAERTGAPVRGLSPEQCFDAPALTDGEWVRAAGIRVQVVTTPGHTADSVSLWLPADAGGDGSMITGDTILGRGTTIIAQPDGSLGDYLASLDRLETYGEVTTIPAHGPLLPSLAAVSAQYRQHRLGRLAQVRSALEQAGIPVAATPDAVRTVVDAVYGDLDPALRFAAEASTAAQLEYLALTP